MALQITTTPGADNRARFYSKSKAPVETERFMRLSRHEAIQRGAQYGGRPSWWDRSVDIQNRAPLIVYPIARIGALRLTSFVFGEGRFPTCTVGSGGSDLQGLALNPDQAQTLLQGVASVIEAAKLKLTMRRGMMMGLGTGTACAIGSIRAGRICWDWVCAKWCTPEFDPFETDKVTKLTIRYKHTSETLRDSSGTLIPVWYLRVIDACSDICWDDVPCDPNEQEPIWSAFEPKQKFTTDFCCVVWARNDPDPGTPSIDGRPLAEGLEDECEALDRTLSQRDRNALYNGDPQMILVGANQEDLQTAEGSGPPAPLQGTTAGGNAGNFFQRAWRTVTGQMGGSGGGAGGAGTVWAVKNESGNGDAKMLESSGSGATVLSNHARDLRALILEAMQVVIIDPEKASSDISAAAMRNLLAPMLAQCDTLRECWGEVLLRIIGMSLRLLTTKAAWEQDPIAGVPTGRSAMRGIPNMMELAAVLKVFQLQTEQPDGDVVTDWYNPPLTLAWGAYIEETWQDRLASAQAAQLILAEGTLTKRTVVQQLAKLWGVEDIETEVQETGADEAQKSAGAANLLSHVMGNAARGLPPTAPKTAPAGAQQGP